MKVLSCKSKLCDFLLVPECYKAFAKHIQTEFSAENLEFYMAVCRFEDLPEGEMPAEAKKVKGPYSLFMSRKYFLVDDFHFVLVWYSLLPLLPFENQCAIYPILNPRKHPPFFYQNTHSRGKECFFSLSLRKFIIIVAKINLYQNFYLSEKPLIILIHQSFPPGYLLQQKHNHTYRS